jgi:ABC-type branched-subunit amino acid transport system substrate-binding protein
LAVSQIITLSIGVNFHKENSKYNQIIDKIISEKDDGKYVNITIEETAPAKRKTSFVENIKNSLQGKGLDKDTKTTLDKIARKAWFIS